MIRFKIITSKEVKEKEDVEISLPRELEDDIMNALKTEFLMEILAGERTIIKNDVHYKFQLQKEDAEMLKSFLLTTYTKLSGFNTNN